MAHDEVLRTVTATRYLTALRASSSVPIVVEADDDGVYLLKLRGAGQGARALTAELVAGALGRALGLPVPELVLVEFAPAVGATERDAELRDLFAASYGLGVGLDYLPGAAAFDPLRHAAPPELAARVVLFDTYVMNVDRRRRPNNLLVWHDRLHLIDHGAALAFQYDWDAAFADPAVACPLVEQHVLLPFAGSLREAVPMLRAIDAEMLRAIVATVPDVWLTGEPRFADADAYRAAYVDVLWRRRAPPMPAFVEAAERVRVQQARRPAATGEYS
jgi:hypothetical protein